MRLLLLGRTEYKDVAYCYRCSMICVSMYVSECKCLSVCLSVGHNCESPINMAEPIEVLFVMCTQVGPRNQICPWEGAI